MWLLAPSLKSALCPCLSQMTQLSQQSYPTGQAYVLSYVLSVPSTLPSLEVNGTDCLDSEVSHPQCCFMPSLLLPNLDQRFREPHFSPFLPHCLLSHRCRALFRSHVSGWYGLAVELLTLVGLLIQLL